MAAELGEFSRWLTWAGRAMRSWRGVVVAGGPARVAACRDVREGRKAVMRLVRAAGSARATQAAQAVRLVRACAQELAEVEETLPPLGDDAVAAWAVVRGVRRWRLRVARRLLAAGVVLREPRSVVVRRLMRASLGQVQLVARVELTARERSDAQGPVGLGLAGDAAMAGLAYVSLGGGEALRRWLAWRRGPGQVRLQAAAMHRWACEVDGLRWRRHGTTRPEGGVLLENERLAGALERLRRGRRGVRVHWWRAGDRRGTVNRQHKRQRISMQNNICSHHQLNAAYEFSRDLEPSPHLRMFATFQPAAHRCLLAAASSQLQSPCGRGRGLLLGAEAAALVRWAAPCDGGGPWVARGWPVGARGRPWVARGAPVGLPWGSRPSARPSDLQKIIQKP